jgi:hypothetical protein
MDWASTSERHEVHIFLGQDLDIEISPLRVWKHDMARLSEGGTCPNPRLWLTRKVSLRESDWHCPYGSLYNNATVPS